MANNSNSMLINFIGMGTSGPTVPPIPPPPRYAIAHPNNSAPSAAWFAANVAEATATKWDGYVLEPILSTGQLLKDQAFARAGTALNSTNLANTVTSLNGISWGANKKPSFIFFLVNATDSSGFDWNNSTHIQRLIDNFTALGVASNTIRLATGIKIGILFNTEFTASIWRYDSLTNPGARSYAQTQTDVRAAMTSIFNGYWNANPSGNVSITIGTHFANRNSQIGVQSADYSLIRPCVLGMLDSQVLSSGEYFGEYGRSAFTMATADAIENLKNNITTGFYSASGHLAQLENISQRTRYGFDVALSSGNKSRRIISPALVSGNTITFRDSSHFFQAGDVGLEIYIFGLGVRNITAVSGATVTFDGNLSNVADKGFACSQKPLVVYTALRAGLQRASRFVFEYFLGDNKDATDTTTVATNARIPLEMRNAFTRAIQGLDTTGLEDIELNTSGEIISESVFNAVIPLTSQAYEFQFDVATSPVDDKSFGNRNATITGTLLEATSNTGDKGVRFTSGTVGANFAAIPSDSSLQIGTQTPTWIVKFKTPATLATGNFCARFDDTATTGLGSEYFFRLNNTGTLQFFFGSTSLVTTQVLIPNTVYIALAWKEGTSIYIQIDNATPEVKSTSVPASVTGTSVKETIGAIRESGIAANRIAFTGDLFFCSRFNRVLDSTERTAVFNILKEPATPFRTVASFEAAAASKRTLVKNKVIADTSAIVTATGEINSIRMIDNSYGLSGFVRFYRATLNPSYVADAIICVKAWINASKTSESFPNSDWAAHATKGLKGWIDTSGEEQVLYEGYFWRHVAELLWRMKQNNLHTNITYSANYNLILNFFEVNVFDKWWQRNVRSRTNTHMTTHFGQQALFGRRVFTSSSVIAAAEETLNRYLGTASPFTNMNGLNFFNAWGNHSSLGAAGVTLRQAWNDAASIEDSAHFNHVCSFMFEAYLDSYLPTGRSAGYLNSLIERIRATFEVWIWNNGGSFREFISSLTSTYGGFSSEGLLLLCALSDQMQLNIAEAPIPTGSLGNNGTESSFQWLATAALTRTFRP